MEGVDLPSHGAETAESSLEEKSSSSSSSSPSPPPPPSTSSYSIPKLEESKEKISFSIEEVSSAADLGLPVESWLTPLSAGRLTIHENSTASAASLENEGAK